jgi:hypothetical protein
MATIDKYRQYVQQFLSDYANLVASSSIEAKHEVEAELVFDTERDRYQVVDVGWQNGRRVYGCVLHIDIKDGKLWIQHNSTEIRIAEEFLNLGVPREHIVLGFQPEYTRQRSGFAVN